MESAIQRQTKENNKGFWNWKRVLLISVTSVLTIGLMILTIISITPPKFHWDDFKDSINVNSGLWAGMLIILISWMIFNFLYRAIPVVLRLKKMRIKISFGQQLIFVCSITFMNAVTPPVLITEPYIVFWLKSHGVTTADATAIVWINDFLWHIISVVIVVPSFAILCTNQSLMNYLTTDGIGISIFTLICIGFSLDIIMFAVYLFMGFSKHFHYLLSYCFNAVKKWLHLKYHTKAQTKKTYLHDAILQRKAKELLSDWKSTILTLAIAGIFQVVIYTSLYSALCIIDMSDMTKASTNFWHIFNVANVIFVANKYVPIPNGEGLTQWQMWHVINNLQSDPKIIGEEKVLDTSIFVWRFFTNYLPAALGLAGFITFIVTYVKKSKKKAIKKAIK